MVKLTTSSAKVREKSRAYIPSMDAIKGDKITELSHKYWASYNPEEHAPFDQSIVDDIYLNELVQSSFHTRSVALLEISQYLENYLWPNFNFETSSFSHVMSMVCMITEKHREGLAMWECFENDPDKFAKFFHRVLSAVVGEASECLGEGRTLLHFLSCAFGSLEVDLVRKQLQGLASLHVWHCLSEGRREEEFKRFSKWKKYWKAMLKRDAKESDEKKELNEFNRTFMQKLIKNFLELLDKQDYMQPELDLNFLRYTERFMELMIDLQALLPTRRYLNVLIDDLHLIVRCQMSPLLEHGDGHLFSQLLDRLKFYENFEIDNETGDSLSELEVMKQHYNKITTLQEKVFTGVAELRQFSLSNVCNIDTRASLLKHFKQLDEQQLKDLAASLHLIPNASEDLSETFILEIMIRKYEKRTSQIKQLNAMALYPTEEVIWDENVVPSDYHSASGQVLALPKLNLQFLTLHDYLLRNFDLFRLESTYQIRQDIEDAIFRLQPWQAEDGSCLFHGWARMAQPVHRFSVIQVSKPNLGESKPSMVKADVTINLSVRREVKAEWESLRRHDACFLVTIKPPNKAPKRYDLRGDFVSQVGVAYVRGCEIEGMLDSNGRVIEEGPDPRPFLQGDSRTFRVLLDPNQYQKDMDAIASGKEDVYETLNVFMRRKPKENNFKAVLETIRDLMNTNCVVPEWLHDIILGYGDPGSAHYSKLPNQLSVLDFNDTFLDVDHLKESFPGHAIELKSEGCAVERPFRLHFEKAENTENSSDSKSLIVEPYSLPGRGPYAANVPNFNTVRFTPTQIEAIKSGMQPGLTLVVGPPGTGKTDVATQIISNIYHNFPDQRTLIVTHSNQALNQLFEKIIKLDVDERHLLRLGHGEEALETEKDFSRYGRVNFVLAKRLDLLIQVDKLQRSIGVPGDVAYTCETSWFFYVHHVLANWEAFLMKVKPKSGQPVSPDVIDAAFPFHRFFEDAQPLFSNKDFDADFAVAEGCFRYIKHIFDQLEEFRAFELLRSGLDRSKYLLVKEARVIAMTCTHSALKRRELVDLVFQYDNILMEESAQILEIETFIPLLLQNPAEGKVRLKRWIMIGDHHQLPPVIKNMAFQKYGNMEQSLFARFVRLGVPTIELDAQGRSRASIANLYKWRYKNLGNLPHVLKETEYQLANPGFQFEYQVINVKDYNGAGETEPSPYFFQNLAEAEYVVATFMYMRLKGYPAEKITILTTYNGQKALIRDVLNTRCANNPWFGMPHKVATVDKYQGQQNDYILLSLVRTRTVGHLRDIRRLIVAMSRARLGLYVFARIPLFANCYELAPAFQILTNRSTTMQLYPSETYPTTRKLEEQMDEVVTVKDMPQMATLVYEMYMKQIETLRKEEALKAEEMKKLIPEPVASDKGQIPTPIEFEGERVHDSKEVKMEVDVDEASTDKTEEEMEVDTSKEKETSDDGKSKDEDDAEKKDEAASEGKE